jgi:hypothetical protein
MKITIISKTKNPTKKDFEKSVDLVLDAGKVMANKLKDFDVCRCRRLRDGTSLILIKK